MSSPTNYGSPSWDTIVRVRLSTTFTPDEITNGLALRPVSWPAAMPDANYTVAASIENPQQAAGMEAAAFVATFKKNADGSGIVVGIAIEQDPGGSVVIHALAFHD